MRDALAADPTNDISEDEAEAASGFKKGRPRSERSRTAILRATNSILLHKSVQELSIEAIAKKARVGKTTIYRWWPNKTAVVMEALVNQPGLQTPMATPQDNFDAVHMQLRKLIRILQGKSGETIVQLFSEAQGDKKSYEIFENSFLGPLIDAMAFSIDQGKKDGEFDDSIETRMAVDMICGPVFFRLMAHPADFDKDFEDQYLETALNFLKAA